MFTTSLCESTHQIVLLRGPTAAAQPLNYRNRESLKNYETNKHFKKQFAKGLPSWVNCKLYKLIANRAITHETRNIFVKYNKI
jgi:hypothetical protein